MPRCRTLLTGLCLTIVIGGCKAPAARSAVLRIDAALYDLAFDAAVEVARDAGLSPDLRDRRRGLIETAPRDAGSALEPWRGDNASFDEAVQNTLAYQRRRARFRFAVADEPIKEEDFTDDRPDLLGTRGGPTDLTRVTGLLELRISVILERAHAPGMRRNPWSHSLNTQATIARADTPTQPAFFWAPVSRDLQYEQRLLRSVADTIARASAAAADP